MSKHINVNPDHYKVAGRERPGNQVAKDPRQSQTQNRDVQARERWEERQKVQVKRQKEKGKVKKGKQEAR